MAYFEKEAKWDNYLLVVMVTGRLEKVLMFVGFVCKSVDLVVAEVYQYI